VCEQKRREKWESDRAWRRAGRGGGIYGMYGMRGDEFGLHIFSALAKKVTVQTLYTYIKESDTFCSYFFRLKDSEFFLEFGTIHLPR